LIKSNANIREINCIRKHLSAVKGGKLVENIQCDAISLVMSDVIGNDLSVISSGCTYYDKTTFLDALKIIKKYKLEALIPKKIIKRFNEGKSKKTLETPKKPKIKNIIVSTNRDCLKIMVKKSKQFGFFTKSLYPVSGNVELAAKNITQQLPKKKPSCLIFGGETTVHVTGNGKGGRNQELVLRILKQVQKTKQNFLIASVGTDGIDGNTEYAGAIIENFHTSVNEIERCLKNNNSNLFFKRYGGLIKTGYTHTNLMDIGLIIKY